MTARDCPTCATRPLATRLLTLTASQLALVAAADQLDDRATFRELAGATSLVDALTVERVTSWLRRRGELYADAAVALGESTLPLVEAASAAVEQQTADVVRQATPSVMRASVSVVLGGQRS